MEDEEFTNLLSQLEDQVSTIKYDFEISEAFNKLIEEYKDKLSPEQRQQLEWEFLLFRLMTKNRFSSDGLKTERFKPMMTWTNGSIFPDPDGFPEEAYSYFEQRLKVSKSSILKARYLDFLWEKSKLKQKHLFAQQAVEQYLQTVDEYENEDAIIERLDGLQRAAELVLILEGKIEKKPLTEKVITKINEQIDITAQGGKFRWLIEMFELVLAFPLFYAQNQIKGFIELCEKAAASYHAEQNYHIQRSFLQLKASLIKLLTSPSKDIDDEIGQSLLDEAEAKSGSGLVKVHFLQEAIDHYAKLGNTQKVKELTEQVKAVTTQAIEGEEFKQISTTIEIKKEVIEKIKNSLGTGEEVPERMGTVPTFFPDWNHAVKMTEDHRKKFVFMHLGGVVHYGSKYPVGRPKTQEEINEDQVMHNFQLEAELALNWLTDFLTQLRKEEKVSLKDFEKFFEKLTLVDKDTHETVLVGLESFFKDDYFHATHVLAVQLEDFLRHLLSVFGGQTTIPEKGAFREKTLGSILTELEPHISEPLYRYISWVMEDYRGFNLRNNIAHGFFKKKHARALYATAILHIFCILLANLGVKDKEEKESGA